MTYSRLPLQRRMLVEQISLARLLPLFERALERASLRDIAERSYVHSNGFLKLVVSAEGKFGGKVRLHDWDPIHVGSESDIHDHAWPYASAVINGRLDMETFKFDPLGQEFDGTRVGTLAAPGMIELGTTKIAVASEHRFDEGAVYECSPDVSHRFSRVEPGSITVVAQGHHVKSYTTVYRAGERQLIPYDVRRPEVDEVYRSLQRSLEALDRWIPADKLQVRSVGYE